LSVYRHHVFPWVLELVMNQRVFRRLRGEALAPATGRVLEIGFGTGINLPYYPAGTHRIVGVDSNPGVTRMARRRAGRSHIEVEHHHLSAETLPFDDASFDTVVSTFTLCSIPDLQRALAEVRRVLRPGGEFLFLEHGLSPDPSVARWQKRLNPAWQVVGDGCQLDRDATAEVTRAGLGIERVRNFYLPRSLRFAGYMYLGAARRKDGPVRC
jgi:ubiquinone/menaquinone biosynthesis C-methylase UbiE